MLEKYDDKYEFWQKFLLEYYVYTDDTLEELSEKLDITVRRISYFLRKEGIVKRDNQKYSNNQYSFLLYKGDDLLYDGTMDEIMEKFDMSERQFKWYASPYAEKRQKGNGKYIKRKYPRATKEKEERWVKFLDVL